jgi:hypothetical protein
MSPRRRGWRAGEGLTLALHLRIVAPARVLQHAVVQLCQGIAPERLSGLISSRWRIAPSARR